MEMEEDDVTDEDVEVIVVVVDDEDELGADFTVIGVAVPGGRGEYNNLLFPTTFSGISQSAYKNSQKSPFFMYFGQI